MRVRVLDERVLFVVNYSSSTSIIILLARYFLFSPAKLNNKTSLTLFILLHFFVLFCIAFLQQLQNTQSVCSIATLHIDQLVKHILLLLLLL